MSHCEETCHPAPKLVAGSRPPACGYDADVIILTRDRLPETLAAVDSALRQRNMSFHVSVLDQGSAAPARRAYAAAFGAYPNVGYYVSEANLGVAQGRNFLSALGSGKVIVALDNDAVFADDLVAARALARFEQSPDLGIIGFRIAARDGILLDDFSWGYPQSLKLCAHGSFTTTTFVGAGHAIRRRAWIAAGGYDAMLFFTWEEYDFALRAIALGWQVRYEGALAVIHKVSPQARVAWQDERMRLFVRNRLIVARKWDVSWIALLPRICGYILRAARSNALGPALRGLAGAVAMDRLLLKRKMTPKMREYLKRNETRFRESLLRSAYRHALLQARADP